MAAQQAHINTIEDFVFNIDPQRLNNFEGIPDDAFLDMIIAEDRRSVTITAIWDEDKEAAVIGSSESKSCYTRETNISFKGIKYFSFEEGDNTHHNKNVETKTKNVSKSQSDTGKGSTKKGRTIFAANNKKKNRKK